MVSFYFEAENSYGALLEQEAAVKFKVKSKSDDGWKYVEKNCAIDK